MLDWGPDSVAALLPALDIAQWLVAATLKLKSMISPAAADAPEQQSNQNEGVDIYKSYDSAQGLEKETLLNEKNTPGS